MKIKNIQISSFSVYVALMMCVAIFVIIWSAHARFNEHNKYHLDASAITSSKTADELSFYIKERKRLVNLFAQRRSAELAEALQHPEDDHLYNKILVELNEHFPDLSSFTLATHEGEVKRGIFDNLIGQLCLDDIKYYTQTGHQKIRIHPADEYHFDIIVTFPQSYNVGILFVSFKTDMISKLLRQSEIPGHQLLLVLPKMENLIEVTSEGSRNAWVQKDYRLKQPEIDRVLSVATVEDTDWEIFGLNNIDLFSDYKKLILLQSNLVIIILAGSALLFMILNHREIRRREKAEIAKDEFLSIVSHELRTPLTSIRGAITLIINGATGEINQKTKSILNIADNNTHRLTALVNDLLDVQKLESGQLKYKRRLIHPIEFIDNAVESIYSSYFPVPWKINISNHLEHELVFADRSRMEQVTANIISNAIKYGSKKDNIDITLKRHKDDIVIAITDYGKGIDENSHDEIFEKFTQTKMTDNRHESGSGLGLYIAKIIVEYHDGEITYTSIKDKGTTFYIHLPIFSIKKNSTYQSKSRH